MIFGDLNQDGREDDTDDLLGFWLFDELGELDEKFLLTPPPNDDGDADPPPPPQAPPA
jgi:hypothetical protein